MKRVQVLIPFYMKATNTEHIPGDIIEVSEETLDKIKAVNVNMVQVLGDVEEVIEEKSEEITEEVIDEIPEEITDKTIEEKPKRKKKQ